MASTIVAAIAQAVPLLFTGNVGLLTSRGLSPALGRIYSGGVGALLLSSGDFLLQQDGSLILVR